MQAAQAAAGHQHFTRGALYVVATPIGNLADLSLRAIDILARVDGWACEDTRVSAQLMRHLGLDKPLLALHEHNEMQAAGQLLQRLQAGQSWAYVSDAGTPAVSDPGAQLVAQVVGAGLPVVPVPGASAVLAALSVAGDVHGQGFHFAGFLPAKGPARRAALEVLRDQAGTQVLFEAPHRIVELAGLLAELLPQRRVTVCRELTKQFESIVQMSCAELPAWLEAEPMRRRGEFVLVLHAPPARDVDAAAGELDAASERCLELLLAELPLKQAVALAAQITRAPRNALYERALARRQAD